MAREAKSVSPHPAGLSDDAEAESHVSLLSFAKA